MESEITNIPYKPQYAVRIVTAGSLFDGHDAAINIMRRLMQSSGAEVIHLGHNRSALEIVETAIQEDVQAIAITSYQGGHTEFFKYVFDLLKEKNAGHIKIFGGGGGTILPQEIEELHQYGITRIYSPDDGRSMGLQGMIDDLLQKSDFPLTWCQKEVRFDSPDSSKESTLARLITLAENDPERLSEVLTKVPPTASQPVVPVLGITGTGGAGKSSVVDELIRRFLLEHKSKTVAVVSVDPTKRKSGGALLGDRIRMNALNPEFSQGRVY
ncbi:MAG: cobalamin-dependent protein, partial [Bacteroidetes bacterium]|nr:cobalamin-dependent protein [Bacteroidota bacterium]